MAERDGSPPSSKRGVTQSWRRWWWLAAPPLACAVLWGAWSLTAGVAQQVLVVVSGLAFLVVGVEVCAVVFFVGAHGLGRAQDEWRDWRPAHPRTRLDTWAWCLFGVAVLFVLITHPAARGPQTELDELLLIGVLALVCASLGVALFLALFLFEDRRGAPAVAPARRWARRSAAVVAVICSAGAGALIWADWTGTSFCDTHACIPNFGNGRGYIVQCTDGMWSHSGGMQGACADHGGEQ